MERKLTDEKELCHTHRTDNKGDNRSQPLSAAPHRARKEKQQINNSYHNHYNFLNDTKAQKCIMECNHHHTANLPPVITGLETFCTRRSLSSIQDGSTLFLWIEFDCSLSLSSERGTWNNIYFLVPLSSDRRVGWSQFVLSYALQKAVWATNHLLFVWGPLLKYFTFFCSFHPLRKTTSIGVFMR